MASRPRISVLPEEAAATTAVAAAGADSGSSPKPPFSLIRYFSVTSLVGFLLVLAVLLLFYRYSAFNAIKEHESRSNVALTQVFANTIWPKHASYIERASSFPKAGLPQRPEIVPL